MANKTTNYGLIKPLPDEFYNVNVFNENMDAIDGILKQNASGKSWNVVVPTTGWTASGTMMMINIEVADMTSAFNPTYGLKPNGNYVTEAEETAFALIKGLVTASGYITLYAEEVPVTSIALVLKGV